LLPSAKPEIRSRFEAILGEAPVAPTVERKLPEHLIPGRDLYLKSCVECHQADGKGVPNTFPPLLESEWVRGDLDTMLRIMLGGLMGPITVNGEEFNSAMPGHSHASDEDIAAVASYVRNAFAHLDEEPVDPAKVKALRPEVDDRKFMPWTVKELPK
jgi:mono/diheme cytochrome c family protein